MKGDAFVSSNVMKKVIVKRRFKKKDKVLLKLARLDKPSGTLKF